MTDSHVVEVFVQAGVLAHEQGVLDRALVELGVRLELKGAGELLSMITDQVCWAAHDGHRSCPACGTALKPNPNPHPKPPPPPPPPKPKGVGE